MQETSVFKGITGNDKGQWKSQFRAGTKLYYLGTFTTPEEAARAYDECLHAFYSHGYRVREVSYNFPNNFAISKPVAYSEVTMRALNDYQAKHPSLRTVPKKAFVPQNEEALRELLTSQYEQLKKISIEVGLVVNRLSEACAALRNPFPLNTQIEETKNQNS